MLITTSITVFSSLLYPLIILGKGKCIWLDLCKMDQRTEQWMIEDVSNDTTLHFQTQTNRSSLGIRTSFLPSFPFLMNWKCSLTLLSSLLKRRRYGRRKRMNKIEWQGKKKKSEKGRNGRNEEETEREERMNEGMKMCWDRSNFSLVFVSSVGGILGLVHFLLSHLLGQRPLREWREGTWTVELHPYYSTLNSNSRSTFGAIIMKAIVSLFLSLSS